MVLVSFKIYTIQYQSHKTPILVISNFCTIYSLRKFPCSITFLNTSSSRITNLLYTKWCRRLRKWKFLLPLKAAKLKALLTKDQNSTCLNANAVIVLFLRWWRGPQMSRGKSGICHVTKSLHGCQMLKRLWRVGLSFSYSFSFFLFICFEQS